VLQQGALGLAFVQAVAASAWLLLQMNGEQHSEASFARVADTTDADSFLLSKEMHRFLVKSWPRKKKDHPPAAARAVRSGRCAALLVLR
jgi:hypothetical protein